MTTESFTKNCSFEKKAKKIEFFGNSAIIIDLQYICAGLQTLYGYSLGCMKP